MKYKILLISSLALMLLFVEGLRAQSPTSPAKRFGIFISGNLKLGNSHEVEGPVAVGGNLTSGQYQIKFENAYNPFTVQGAPVSLAVRGGVKLNGGILRVLNDKYAKIGNCSPSTSGLNNLKVWLKDANNSPNIIKITDVGDNYGSTQNSIELSARATTFTPNISNDVNPVCEQVFGTGTGQIDIDAAFVNMAQRSTQLAALTDNLPIYNVDSKTSIAGPILNPALLDQNVKLIVNPAIVNVLTVSAAVWSSIRGTLTFENMPSGPSQPNVESSTFGVIINIINVPDVATVDGAKEIKFPNFGGLQDSHASYILYNFPDATTTLRLKGQVLFGAIFAPKADLLKANSGNLNGQVIAKSFIHESDEIHYWPFITSIPEPVKSITVAATSKCLNDAPYLDYSVTPVNFDATGQTAKIEWINSAGTVVRTDAGQPITGSLLFPGAALGPDGKGIAWPGWVLNGDTYEPSTDLNSTIKDAGATIRVTLDKTQTISISYPAGSNGCLVSPPPPPHKITVTATSKCFDDAPYLDYSITPNFDAAGQTAKIEWINSAGTVVHEETVSQLSGSLLFPGAALGPDGKGIAWPGWVLNGDTYEPSTDLNSTIKDAGATIRVTLDKIQTIAISYPDGSSGCLVSPPLPPHKITVVATSRCFDDAPYLDYAITPNFDATGQTAKIEWINSAGTVVHEETVSQLSGSLLFPGAALGPDGKGIAWPGWVLNGDTYEPSADLNSTIKDAGATIRVTLDKIQTIEINYPAGSAGCLVSPPPPPHKITVVATSKCLNDAPYLDYTVTPNFDASGLTAKIEWINSAGAVVRTDAGQLLSGSLLFPGAALGIDGKGNAWPGWVLNGTVYQPVTDLNSTIRDAGATIKVTVNPTVVVSISYPPATPGCLVSPPPTTPLPVTLSSFTAKNESCNVQLKWTVTEAKNFSHFDIERSIDAKSFISLSSVNYDATRRDYSATDSPFSSESTPAKYYYYRLKQVDLDETFEYSAIRSVDAGTCDSRLAVNFYPNPTQDEINVKSGSPVKMLEIVSIAGIQLYKINPSQSLTELKVDVRDLAQGLYIVNIINGDGKHSSKILKK